MKDTIYRQDAIDAVKELCEHYTPTKSVKHPHMDFVIEELQHLPSAQPEIIRCKDCKYSDENWRRVSVRWLPCMDMRTGSNWFCGSAERRTDDEG